MDSKEIKEALEQIWLLIEQADDTTNNAKRRMDEALSLIANLRREL